MEVLPDREDMEEERYLDKVHRSQRRKLTDEEIAKLKNFDRPLTKNDWAEMIIETQWATIEVMGFLEAENPVRNPTESKAVTINSRQEETARPKPPPLKAPWELRTYPEDPTQEPMKLADPSSGSANSLGDSDRKERDRKWEIDSEGQEPNGEIDPGGKSIPKATIP